MTPTICESCGVEGPTKYVELYQNIGMLFARRTVSVKRHLCRSCIGRYFKSFTLFLGWWGTISFFITPLILINNCARFLLALRLPRPSMAVTNAPIDAAPPPIGSESPKFKFIYGAIVCAVVLGVLAYHNVSFMEKHAPALNATMHGGEISDEQDEEYHGTKWFEDTTAILADTKRQDWDGYRAEMLIREHYFTDLAQENDRIQSALVRERTANLGAGDVCEQLALDEMGPAMNDLTKVEGETFSVIQRAATPSAETRALLHGLADREDSAIKRFDTYTSDRDRHGCK